MTADFLMMPDAWWFADYLNGIERENADLREKVRALTGLSDGAAALLRRVERLEIEKELSVSDANFIHAHIHDWLRDHAALAAAKGETVTSEGKGI